MNLYFQALPSLKAGRRPKAGIAPAAADFHARSRFHIILD